MADWTGYTEYWKSLHLSDLLGILFLLSQVLVIMISFRLFQSFITSKPAGRKTVLGNRVS
jgi:hypothetical protein